MSKTRKIKTALSDTKNQSRDSHSGNSEYCIQQQMRYTCILIAFNFCKKGNKDHMAINSRGCLNVMLYQICNCMYIA